MKNTERTLLHKLTCSVLVPLGALALTSSFVSAQTSISFSDDFSYPNGSLPSDWEAPNVSGFSHEGADGADIQSGTLRLIRKSKPGNPPGAAGARRAGYTGTGSGAWADYTVEVLMELDENNDNELVPGLIGRWQGTSDPDAGYVASLSRSTRGELLIGRDLPSGLPADPILGTTSLSRNVGPDETVRMVFELNGSSLSAEVFGEGTVGGVYDDSLGSLTVTDSTYSQGSVGVASVPNFAGRQVNFDDISVTGIPEPQTFTMIFGALALGVVLTRRKRCG